MQDKGFSALAQGCNRTRCGTPRLAGLICSLVLFCVAAVNDSPAQNGSFSTLVNFDVSNGAFPYATLAQGVDGDLYGTTRWGGAYSNGTVFKSTASGELTTLYSFCSQQGCPDGYFPYTGLVLANDGNFYGTTSGSPGTGSYGTVFRITASGTLTTLHRFCGQPSCLDGFWPSTLMQGVDGYLYGTTESGGAHGGGTAFRITTGGAFTTLYSFCSQPYCADGGYPSWGLVQGNDGNFYGTTSGGGARRVALCNNSGCGTIFRMTASGVVTPLYSFCSFQPTCVDGWDPVGLIQAKDGNFYGTTILAGAHGGGTVFKITAGGRLTTIYSFSGNDGAWPSSGVLQGSDGNFYGTTAYGGINNCANQPGCGTVFEITPGGTLTTLHFFDGADGSDPVAGLLQVSDGSFYGTTLSGGTDGYGTVFRITTGSL